jgi:hypothetical protein
MKGNENLKMLDPNPKDYDDYWLSYLRSHTKWMNRFFPFLGTVFGVMGLLFATYYFSFIYGVLIGGAGYCVALIGHFLFQRNLPHASKPHLSLYSDFRMLFLFVTNRSKLNSEIARATNQKL